MKNDAFFLRHILDAVNQIEEYTNITYEEFLETRLIQDGLLNRIMTVPPAAGSCFDTRCINLLKNINICSKITCHFQNI